MGQQQLLLIVLGVIVVGIAVVVGINLFQANAESSTQDSMVSQGQALGALAQQFFKKPTAMGGGGNTFASFGTDDVSADLLNTPDADWVIGTGTTTSVTITGTPKDAGYKAEWTVVATVTGTGITSVVKKGS
jgi:hypothetical protein